MTFSRPLQNHKYTKYVSQKTERINDVIVQWKFPLRSCISSCISITVASEEKKCTVVPKYHIEKYISQLLTHIKLDLLNPPLASPHMLYNT